MEKAVWCCVGANNIILLVEDDEVIRESLQDILQGEGYTISTAENGKQALDLLRAGLRPCLILLDLMMPVMSGREFLDEIKKQSSGELAKIPVIIVTATAEVAGETLKLAVDLVKKPINIELLLSRISTFCVTSPTAQTP